MTNKSMSIREAVEDLNDSIFLPAIQREFVWDTDQIIRLFDSVLRDYPIGAFLLWRVRGETADDQIKYKFIRNYIGDSVHPDDPKFNHVNYHNPKVPSMEKLPETQKLILDGQQRLTAFYIGLSGTYAEKKKFHPRKNASAWSNKQLYFNLFSDPDEEIEDELGLKYEFAFKDSQPDPTEETYWYPVGDILELDPNDDVRGVVEDLDLESFGKGKRWDASENLRTLHDSICDEAGIQYHEETTENHERVLDIFIRTNDGGTPLSKSEILLSMATARWTEGPNELDAREQITDFVDRLNERHEDKNFRFGIDFVLKSLLVLSDLDPEYRIANFTNDHLGEMKETWVTGDYKAAIEGALDLVVEFGLDKRSLTSHNALIPIAYYIYYRNPDLSWDSENGRMIAGASTTGSHRRSSTGRSTRVQTKFWTTLGRRCRKQTTPDSRSKRFIDGCAGAGKSLGSARKSSSPCWRILPTAPRSRSSCCRSCTSQELFARARTTIGTTSSPEDPRCEQPRQESRSGSCRRGAVREPSRLHRESPAHHRGENTGKRDESFDDWLDTRNEDYYERHLIPREDHLHELENFLDFLDAREQRIREHIRETFSAFA